MKESSAPNRVLRTKTNGEKETSYERLWLSRILLSLTTTSRIMIWLINLQISCALRDQVLYRLKFSAQGEAKIRKNLVFLLLPDRPFDTFSKCTPCGHVS